eukprot:g8815.t1
MFANQKLSEHAINEKTVNSPFHGLQDIVRFESSDPKAVEAMMKQQPIIISKTNLSEGLIEKWCDLEYLAANMSPNALFQTYFARKTFLYSDQGKTDCPYVFQNKVRGEKMPFQQFKHLIEKKTNNNECNELIYLQQPLYAGIGENITKDFSSINWAWINAMKLQLNFGPLTTNALLIGQERSVTPLHYDEQDNFLHQVSGDKTCFLFDPSHFKYFYPHPLHHVCDRQSQINFDAIDFDRFSNLKNILCNDGKSNTCKDKLYHGYKCTLKPGDVLYIPKYWWHHITNSKNISIAINFWFKAPSLDENILKHIPLVIPELKVSLSRNIEKLAAAELKSKYKAASFFQYYDEKFNGKNNNIIECHEDYFKIVMSRLKIVLREEDIIPFLKEFFFNGRFSFQVLK